MAKVIRGLILALFAGLIVTTGCGGGGGGGGITQSAGPSSSTAISASPSSLDFSTVAVGSESGPKSIAFSNNGQNAIAVAAISATQNFSVSSTCGSSVPAGSSCQIEVRFAPSDIGSQTGTLTITAGGTSAHVALSGTGGSLAHASGPGIPILTNAWTTFQTNGFPVEIVGYDALAFAPDDALGIGQTGRFLTLGKYFQYSSEPNYCIDGWSYKENRWDVLDCNLAYHTSHGMEAGHTNGAWNITPSSPFSSYSNSLFYWGGQSGSNMPEIAHHTWGWDLGGRTGRDWTDRKSVV